MVFSIFFKVGDLQFRSNFDDKSVLDPGSIFGLIFDGSGMDLGGFLGPEINQNRYQIRDRFLEGLKIAD